MLESSVTQPSLLRVEEGKRSKLYAGRGNRILFEVVFIEYSFCGYISVL